jgi:hypothetical protein
MLELDRSCRNHCFPSARLSALLLRRERAAAPVGEKLMSAFRDERKNATLANTVCIQLMAAHKI